MLESYYLTADVVPIILFFFYWFHSVISSPTSIAGGLFGATPLYIKGQLAIFELIVA